MKPRNRDKLVRVADTLVFAVSTMLADVPYWVTLTPSESRRPFRHAWYRNHAAGRREFRAFVRMLCAGRKS